MPAVASSRTTPSGRPAARLPSATFKSFRTYLQGLRDRKEGPVRPPDVNEATWSQIHASLSALGLVTIDSPTLRLERLVRCQLSVLAVLIEQYGDGIVTAINDGRSWELCDGLPEPGYSAKRRFESFVRGALREDGRSPVRPPRPRRVDTDEPSDRVRLHMELLRRHVDRLQDALDRRVAAGDYDGAQRCQMLLLRALDHLGQP